MAATDLGKVGMVMKGNWSSSATYEVLDVVSYDNGLYIAKQAVPANTSPTNTTYWQAATTKLYPVVEIERNISNSSPYSFDMTTLQHHFYIMEASYSTGSISGLAVLNKANNTISYYNIKEPSTLLSITITGTTISFSVPSGYGASLVRFIALC